MEVKDEELRFAAEYEDKANDNALWFELRSILVVYVKLVWLEMLFILLVADNKYTKNAVT